MKKLLTAILLILFSSANILAGCSLVELDVDRYLDLVVAKAGAVEITKEELLIEYNNNGYKYVQEQDYTVEEAIEQTLADIIDRELLIQDVKGRVDSGDIDEPTINQINDVWEETFDYIRKKIETEETEVRLDWGLQQPGEPEEEEESDAIVFIPYEPKVEYVDGEFIKIEDPEEAVDDFTLTIADFPYSNFTSSISEEAMSRYVKDLELSEEGKDLSTIDSEVFERELQRIFDVYEKNMYLDILEDYYNNQLALDNTKIIERYKEMVLEDVAEYAANEEAYHTAMADSPEDVYYHLEGEYIYVKHVLLPYSDQQLEILEGYKSDLEQGYKDQAQYDDLTEALALSIQTQARDEEGNFVGDYYSANSVLNEINLALSTTSNVEEKAEIFNNFIYKYNTDPGMLNSDYSYVVNLDTEVEDKMVKPFADTSRELHATGEGSLSGLVLTDYGYHIILYTREVANIVPLENLQTITPQALDNYNLSLGIDHSMYDKIYDLIADTGLAYSNYQQSLIVTLNAANPSTYYKDNYKDLL